MSVKGFSFDGGETVEKYDYTELDNKPPIPVVDGTLDVSGAAADAKVVGDEITDLKADLSQMSTASASDVGKALKAKAIANGKVTEWEFGEAGGSSLTADVDIAQNISELYSTTAPTVIVMENDSSYGKGAVCVFEVQAGRTSKGYPRSNGSRVYPIANQGVLTTTNPPYDEIMGVVKSWAGRTNIIHSPSYPDTTGLFGADCAADSNGKFHMNCSDFISAILLGITYDKSRYVLGQAASNVSMDYNIGTTMPASIDTEKTLGGMNVGEMAQWFAEQGRLFSVPSDIEKAVQILQFGDIIFCVDETVAPQRYYGIDHALFVLGAIPVTEQEYGLVVAQCTSTSGGQENQAVRAQLLDPRIWGGKFFARPCYRTSLAPKEQLAPKGNGSFVYNIKLLLCSEIILDDRNQRAAGTMAPSYSKACTADYYKAFPNWVIAYTGKVKTSDNIYYLVRVTEYDKYYNQVKRGTTICSGGTVTPLTLSATTQYVRFTFGISASASRYLYLSDLDDCELTITPPSA